MKAGSRSYETEPTGRVFTGGGAGFAGGLFVYVCVCVCGVSVYVCKCMCMSERRCGHSNKNAQSCDVNCDRVYKL